LMSADSKNGLPERFDFRAAEERNQALWEELGVGRSDGAAARADNFVIDSPPPTVSGSLHIGHMFSYAHQDIIARQRRMSGMNVIYPMGWDDNGLPTERRVQNYFGVRAELDAPYIADLDVDAERRRLGLKKDRQLVVSRQNFIELCHQVVEQDEVVFENLFKRMCYSIDWSAKYTTVSAYCRRIAQRSFIDLHSKGHVYGIETPTMWDVDFQTAVAQAEVEDRMVAGAYHDIKFGVCAGAADAPQDGFVISTTRPELLAACVGVAAHPNDKRYRHLFGKHALTPAFFVKVPIFASEAVEMDKGTGILMVCTFGDQMDVQWRRENDLALRQIVGKNGRLAARVFGSDGWESTNADLANANYSQISGKNLKAARQAVVTFLRDRANSATGDGAPLQGEPRPIQHSVRFYERGERPLEYLSQRQWFVSLLDKKNRLLDMGRRINWRPEFMEKRYISWTENLNADWCISRQRYFGVPIPVWYKLDERGAPIFSQPLIANTDNLPIDPLIDIPDGYAAEQRDQPRGFTAERDVFDTWFTSSMTPQIVAKWGENESAFERHMPNDVRPQSHEIIRTWAFYTIAKAMLHHDDIPWRNIVISGWILDPNRKKMSKSKGNVVTPMETLERWGADVIRYWAGSARLGADTAFDENELKIGRKLTTKIFNASKFAHMQGLRRGQIVCELDLGFIASLRRVVAAATAAFENFEFSQALEKIEDFFWNAFTDNYIELVKGRASAEGGDGAAKESASATLRVALACLLRLFAPFMPVITDEVWSWRFSAETGLRSIHQAPWPGGANEIADIAIDGIADPDYANSFDLARDAIASVRKAKTELGVSLKTPLKRAAVSCPPDAVAALESVAPDLAAAANVAPSDMKFIESAAANACSAEIEIKT